MKGYFSAMTLAVALVSGPALAQQQTQGHAGHGNAAAAPVSASLAEGEVRKVDKEAKKITLRHGAIANLDMPAMTMVFQVSEAAMLDRVKVGDKVRFVADKVNGAFTITHIEAASS